VLFDRSRYLDSLPRLPLELGICAAMSIRPRLMKPC
jgi:hypothetical protein